MYIRFYFFFCSECGVFVLAHAEYLMEGKLMDSNFDVDAHRDRLATSLYKYGRRKHHGKELSDFEECGVKKKGTSRVIKRNY